MYFKTINFEQVLMVVAKVAKPKRNYWKLEMGGGGRGVSFQGKIERQ